MFYGLIFHLGNHTCDSRKEGVMFINGTGATKHIAIPRNILPHNANLKAEFCFSFKGIFTSIWSTSLNIRKMISLLNFFVNLFKIDQRKEPNYNIPHSPLLPQCY